MMRVLNAGTKIFPLFLFLLFHFDPTVYADVSGEEVWKAFIKEGKIDESLSAFQKAVKANEEDALAHAGIAFLSPSRNADTEVLPHWLSALKFGHLQPEAMLYLCEGMNTLSTHKEYEAALKGLDEINQLNDLPQHLRDMLQYYRARLLQRLGRWEAAANTFDTLGFIAKFWYCGPFDNAEKGGHNRVFGPEEKLDLKETYPGKHRTVGWQPIPVSPYDGYINLHGFISPGQETTTYLAGAFQSPEEQSCRFSLGHAGAIKVWLNGILIADVDRYHTAMPDQVNVESRLAAGANTLLIKVSAGKQGRSGIILHLFPKKHDSLIWFDPNGKETPDLSRHTPQPQQQKEYSFEMEPISIQQLKALGEAEEVQSYRHLFFALLLQRLEVTDENDHSVNTILDKVNQSFPNNPFLIRVLGDSEKQDNRRRLNYAKALEIDPNDQVSFLRLLNYYRRSPYATKGLELIREWKIKHPLPTAAKMDQAHIFNGKGLREAAVEVIQSVSPELGDNEKMTWFDLANFVMTDEQQSDFLKGILAENATQANALHALRRLVLRKGQEEDLAALLKQERWINPFSLTGWIDIARYRQAKGDFEGSLQTLNEAMQVSPDDFEAHRLSAVAYHALQKDGQALKELNASLTVLPSDPWCLEYKKLLQPKEENYAEPYLKKWQDIQIPETLDLSKANYLVLLDQSITKVHANGNSSQTVLEVVKVLTDTGVRARQVDGIYYEGDREEVRIIRARVWKPDGTFYDAPAPERQSASSAADADQKLYQDYNVAILRFPALEKGSVVELEYKKEQKRENIYADYFGDLFFAGDTRLEPSVLSQYVLITPKTRDFYWKYIGPHYPDSITTEPIELMQEPQVTETVEERTYLWMFKNLPTIPREPMMPAGSEILPYVKVSTFKTWDDMARWYWNLSREQLIAGTVVKQSLEKVFEKYREKNGWSKERAFSDWDKVKAVNAFINTDIRYLGLEFGIHGFKPHKVDEICNSQYGDCKDKAALAVAMLKEVGVDANMIILRTTDRGEIDYELPSLGIFNHSIYYVPKLEGGERWIDGTATFFGATELPPADEGANSLIIKPGGGYEFKRITRSHAEDNGGVYTTVLTLNADGNAKGSRAAVFRGIYNPIIRSTYENPVKAKEVVDRMLAGLYPGTQTANLKVSDLTDYSKPERISYDLEIPQYGVKQGTRLAVPSVLMGDNLSPRYAQLSQREYDLVLFFPTTQTYETTINLPKNRSTTLPPDHDLNTEFGQYTRKSALKGESVFIKEEIVMKTIRVPKEKYQEFREFCRKVDTWQDEKLYVE